MAAKEGKTIALKVLVDKQRNRVLFVESGKDFVDIILSFLTMPLGTIVRLTRKQGQSCGIGCMDNLYQSVENFKSEYFQKKILKDMLLRPKNSSEVLCRKLELNIDDTEPTKYYVCYNFLYAKYSKFGQHKCNSFSYSNNMHCGCGSLMSTEIFLSNDEVVDAAAEDGGLFVKGIMFMVTDDLQILPITTETSFTHLKSLGITGRDVLDEKSINVDVEEIVDILRNSFLLEMPLTEVLLQKHVHETLQVSKFQSNNTTQAKSRDTASFESPHIMIKLAISKAQNKIMYAEAGEGFVDFMFSLLTFPLGSVVKLLDQSPSLRCISNLYKTAEGTALAKHVRTASKAVLLSPMVPQPPTYITPVVSGKLIKNPSDSGKAEPLVVAVNSIPFGEFVTKPAMFMITDDLVVTPLSFISCISLLEKENIPMDNIEVRSVNVGQEEVRCI
ncbi:hypothetical protein GIB67_007655 [Kingdonia uniflora]|uniref:DUF674 domain-containing protein n=1 Tax=Kingdonia uniflora TaxID=39325 RepID=A0A7J7N1T8_9MAGN|nr:hypothetical protein GIB67_007655 [Kingdonia uniflora]